MIRVLSLGTFIGALIGFGLGHVTMPAYGATHSCPAGAPISACYYPTNHAQHLTGWTILGVIIGLILGGMVYSAWKSFRPGPTGVA